MRPSKRSRKGAPRNSENSETTRLAQLNIDIYAIIASQLSLSWLKAFSVVSMGTRRACLPFLFHNISLFNEPEDRLSELYDHAVILPYVRLLNVDGFASMHDLAIFKLLSRMPGLLDLKIRLHSEVYPCTTYLTSIFDSIRKYARRARLSLTLVEFSVDGTAFALPTKPFDSLSLGSDPAIPVSTVVAGSRLPKQKHIESNSLFCIQGCLQRNIDLVGSMSFEECKFGQAEPDQHALGYALLPGLRKLSLDGCTLTDFMKVREYEEIEASLEDLKIEHYYGHHIILVTALASYHASTLRLLDIRAITRPEDWRDGIDSAVKLPNLEGLSADTSTAFAILFTARLPRLERLAIEDAPGEDDGIPLIQLFIRISLARFPELKSIKLVASMDTEGECSVLDDAGRLSLQHFQQDCSTRSILLSIGVLLSGETCQCPSFLDLLKGLSDKVETLGVHLLSNSQAQTHSKTPIRIISLRSYILTWRLGRPRRPNASRYLDFRIALGAVLAPNLQNITIEGMEVWPLHLEEMAGVLTGAKGNYPGLQVLEGILYLVPQKEEQTIAKIQTIVCRFRRRLERKGIDTSGFYLLDGLSNEAVYFPELPL